LSSILKALKKVESESPPQEVAPTLLEKIDTKKAINQRIKGAWLFNRIATVLLVILILGLGTWFLWTYKGSLTEMILREAPPESQRGREIVSPAPSEKRPSESDAFREIVTEGTPKPASVPEQVTPKTLPTENDLAPARVAKKPGISPREDAASHRPPQGTVKKPVDDTRYKLEAIVWSNNPESRFAVINGQILRAGSSLEGLSVTEIGRDHVAVRSGGREWKLKFTVE
jgi:hypothetical protein